MDLDDRIIESLHVDGRMTVSAIARRIRAPRAAVAARLEGLRADGTMTVVAAVHPGFRKLTAFAHLSVQASGRPRQVGERIAAMPCAVLVSAVSGEHQIIVELRLPDQAGLYEAIAEIRGIPDVRQVATLLYIDVVKGTFMPARPLAPDLRVDDRDRAIIEFLQADGRVGLATIARAIGMSASAVRTRLGALIDAEVLRIAPAVRRTHPNDGVIAGVGLNVRGDGAAVVDALRAEPRVEYLARTIGRYDVLATIAAHTPGELEDYLDRLSTLDDVAAAQSWVHLKVIEERY